MARDKGRKAASLGKHGVSSVHPTGLVVQMGAVQPSSKDFKLARLYWRPKIHIKTRRYTRVNARTHTDSHIFSAHMCLHQSSNLYSGTPKCGKCWDRVNVANEILLEVYVR